MTRTIMTRAELDALPFPNAVTLHAEDWHKRRDGSWLCDDGDILTAGGLVRFAERCGAALVLASPVLPEAAVEAGAEVLYGRFSTNRVAEYEDADPAPWREAFRAALTAALPLLTAAPSATHWQELAREHEAVLRGDADATERLRRRVEGYFAGEATPSATREEEDR